MRVLVSAQRVRGHDSWLWAGGHGADQGREGQSVAWPGMRVPACRGRHRPQSPRVVAGERVRRINLYGRDIPVILHGTQQTEGKKSKCKVKSGNRSIMM